MQGYPGLSRQIAQDLIAYGRWPLFLLIFIVVSAMSVVYVTQNTRTAIAFHDQLLMERERLEVEWRNQLLEEHALSEHSRIERLASRDQGMVRPDSNREIIVSQ